MSTQYKKPSEVPTDTLIIRVENLADAVTKGESGKDEFTMRIPAECDRDADIVLTEFARRFKELEKQLAKANESALFYKEQYEKTDRECTKLAMRESKANERIAELEKENKRESMELRSRLGSALGRNSEYNSAIENMQQKLAKANERVKELENAILDACSTYHFEPDLSQPTSSLKELLEINSKWVLDQEISSDAARFAIEHKIEVLQELADEDERGTRHVYYRALSKIEQLRKEQSNG